MKCPKCHFENREGVKFCEECGAKMELECPECGAEILLGRKFCGKCGHRLEEVVEAEKTLPEAEGERKYVTVLFSDMSGYTAMSERLDPEDVKEITSRIFGRISKVIGKYEGFVEKFVGDAVMALFGVPKAHEDDPVRAIRAAREIHDLVEALSPELEERVGRPLSMHTGINTGLVVTGEVDMEKGTHGVAGDSINLASRLSGLAKEGEILVAPDTYRQAEGYFTFEALEPTTVKGKTEPVQFYKVISQKEIPITTHRLSGVRADLVGRKVELTELREAVEDLGTGKGGIFSICGDAGTGKSRLVEEFKAHLDLEKIQWLEGHAYAYAQNIPYFPMIDLLNRVFHVEEGDSTEKVRQKVESGIEDLVEKKESIVPYIGSLYSLSYPEIEEVSPEFWKSRLRDALRMILSALAERTPTIYFLEDLHWADPSFVELLRHVLIEIRQPAIVLCVYRPVFSLFTTEQSRSIAKVYHEIRLQDLSSSEAQGMLESLLKTHSIPSDLRRFVQDKAEGNPFYLEELVNSLIESETLIRDNGGWKLTRPIGESNVPSTVQGVISARVDRLERETKRVLQEASVIGRAFLYRILDKMTELKEHIDRCLTGLERLDLIRTRSLQPDLEYMFKHPLTQEVVYNGLLRKERQVIHEKIALVMEQLFHERLPEFYETLAFHFKRGRSVLKAVDYLMKSGEKSVKRYSVEESHQYYKEAFDILTNKPDKSREEEGLLIDLLIEWAYVFYYLGDFNALTELLSAHEDLAESLDDKANVGMFNAWLGFALFMNGKGQVAYQYVRRALELGEETGDQKVIAYAYTWLAWSSWDMGLLDEVITFGERANEIARSIRSDHYLYFKPLLAIGMTCLSRGDRKRALAVGRRMLDYGQKHSNIRSMAMGHVSIAFSHSIAGDFPSAIKSFQRAIQIKADPVYVQYPRCFLGITYLLNGQIQEAQEALEDHLAFNQEFGFHAAGLFGYAALGVVYVVKGELSRGLGMIEEAIHESVEKGRKPATCMLEHTLGNVYLQLIDSDVPFAGEKADEHLNRAVELAKEIGAKGDLSQAYLNLGLLHKAKGRTDQAKKCISNAIQLFEECDAEVYLKQAREALASLG